jgi:hypothetical protein
MKVCATVIFEVMGRPAEFLVESLEGIIKKISEEKGTRLVKNKIHEPQEVGDRKGVFSTFCEADLEFDSPDALFMLVFNYMPANVEVTEPAEWSFKINEFNIFLNELLRKLHQYDSLAKAFILEKNNMQAYIADLQEKLKNLGEEKNIPKLAVTDLGEETIHTMKEEGRKKPIKTKKKRK